LEALSGEISDAAWRHKPNWYLVTTEDLMIPPDQQRSMANRIGATTVETAASHSVFVSQPGAVTEIIKAADGGMT
jgi:pimeloyl-ACP methyl ester carboxylesterase